MLRKSKSNPRQREGVFMEEKKAEEPKKEEVKPKEISISVS